MYLGPAYGSWFWSFRQTGSSLRYVLSPPASLVQLYIFCCWGKRHYRREYTCSWFLSCNSTGNEIFTLAMNVLTVKRESYYLSTGTHCGKQVPELCLHPALSLSRRKQCRKLSGWVHPPASVQGHGKEAATCTLPHEWQGEDKQMWPSSPWDAAPASSSSPLTFTEQPGKREEKKRKKLKTKTQCCDYRNIQKAVYVPHTLVSHLSGILLLGQNMGAWFGTPGVSSCLQPMESDSPMSRELRRKSNSRSWRQVKEIEKTPKNCYCQNA